MNDKNNNFKEINNNEINLEVLKVSISFDCFGFRAIHALCYWPTSRTHSSLMT